MAFRTAIFFVLICVFTARSSNLLPRLFNADENFPVDDPDFGSASFLHLRAGPVAVPRAQALGRRLQAVQVANDDVPTRSFDWGYLRNAKQVLLGTHDPESLDSPELLDHLERHGCWIGGYLGDGGTLGMVIIGPGDALERALNHSHVNWAMPYEAHHKVAPEWNDILAQFHANSSGVPLDEVVSEGGRRLFGVRAVFPTRHRPRPHHPSHERYELQKERIIRYEEEHARGNSGSAAVKDWARAIGQQFPVAHLERNGKDAAKLYVPQEDIPKAIQWLADRDVVHWVEPVPRMVTMNRQASSITQSCEPVPNTNAATNTMPKYHPFWGAGITGKGMIIGIGDSGLDYRHCFFADPDTDWQANIVTIGRVLTFTSETHRKIRLYRAFADFQDDNGHGTHTSGTLAGMPYGNTVAEASAVNIGMAPDAKLAFIDLSSVRDGDRIVTPGNLADDYFRYTTDVGATVHSDSWGSTNIFYDYEAYQIDAYCWENPTFLPVFPAGNDGNLATNGGTSGTSTVNSPATAKNCLAVGATETAGSRETNAEAYVTFTGTILINGVQSTSFPVVLSSFSPSFELANPETVLVRSEPSLACSPLTNGASVAGKIVLVERGSCEFVQKAKYAEQAGAAGVIIYDNVAGAYFEPATSGGTVNIPVGFVPRRIGQNLVAAIGTGQTISISMGPGARKDIGYENLAAFSSQGPVNPDRRIKPDIIAPGIVASAAAGTSCSTTYFSGTSMATPVVAGNAALIQQYFKEGFYPTGTPVPENSFMPTSSLVKAVMMGGAKQITGYEVDTGLPIDPAPSFRQGYGRVFLGGSLELEDNPYNPKAVQVLNSVDIINGQKHTYCVTSTGGPLSITVAWTDHPASSNQRRALVNDIDLVVKAEGFNGIPFLGNGGDIDDSSKADNVNNVEQVRWDYLPAGRVSIEIYGSQIYSNQIGPQPYSLVVNGDFDGTLVAPVPGQDQDECPVLIATITKGPSTITNAPEVVFEFGVGADGSSSGIAFECMLEAVLNGQPVDGQWAECSSPATYRDLPDGEYVFSVKPAQETSVAKQTFVIDRTPPALQLEALDAPIGLGRFKITASDSSTVVSTECMVDGDGVQQVLYAGEIVASSVKPGIWFPCGPDAVSLGWLLPGETLLNTRATDGVGNVSPTDTNAITVPSDAGRTYITDGPFMTIPKSNVTYSLALPQSSQGECALMTWPSDLVSPGVPQQQDWRPCGPQVDLGVITNGKYSFLARSSGAPIELAAISTFVIDEIAPTVNLVGAPTIITQPEATFQFEVSEPGASVECRLTSTTSTDWAYCQSPVVYGNLTDGQYTIEAVATDAVGNRGEAVPQTFVVDTTPPTVSVEYEQATREPRMTVSFTAEDGSGSGVANTTCRVVPVKLVGNQVDVNSTRWDPQPCNSPWTFDLEEGEWEISIVATDYAGLKSLGEPLSVWLDTIPPTPTIVSGPSNDTVVSGGNAIFNITDGTQDAGGSPVLWQGYLSLTSTSIEDQPIETSSLTDSGTTVKSLKATNLGRDDLDKWTNCTMVGCSYAGLGQGSYTFVARGVDLASNLGPESPPYSFRLSGASSSLPTWALIVIIVGSCVTAILLAAIVWCCCWRKPAGARKAGFPPHSYDINSYAANSYAANSYAANSYAANSYPEGFQHGYGARPFTGALSGALPADPIVAQQQALARYGTANRGGQEEDEIQLAMALSLSEHSQK